jgi:hypothetical protein
MPSRHHQGFPRTLSCHLTCRLGRHFCRRLAELRSLLVTDHRSLRRYRIGCLRRSSSVLNCNGFVRFHRRLKSSHGCPDTLLCFRTRLRSCRVPHNRRHIHLGLHSRLRILPSVQVGHIGFRLPLVLAKKWRVRT